MLRHLKQEVYLILLWLAETYDECTQNVCQTIKMIQNLGFKVNYEKSALTPKKKLLFLGFLIDSEVMEIKLPKDKADNLVGIKFAKN